jgi:hypothetical protein
MLIAKAYNVELVVDGRVIRPPGVLLHDPSGSDWPRTSCLITSFKRSGEPLTRPSAEARAWAENPDAVKAGTVDTPPRSLSSWTSVGGCERIRYTRKGEHADHYVHDFDDKEWLVFSRKLPEVYRLGRSMRVELGPRAVFNWRGFVYP